MAATLSVAGCLGYTIESEDDVQQRKARIDELESEVGDLESQVETKDSTIEDLEAEVEQKQSEIEDLEASIEEKDGEIDSLESDLETEQKELISKLYELGESHRQRAFKNWQDGGDLYDQGDYSGASNEWGLAAGQYIDATEVFAEAASIASDQGRSEVADMIESSKNRVQTSATAAHQFSLASYYYSHDNESQGDKHLQEGNSALEELDQYTLYDPSEIDSSLGL
ncbi:hypothetical protein BRC81_03825 [Halobacteriales archaeon QS_1_68_20]|nr:MAG: hypothetical protein BRC81_03825 [Halobacteriales archaeon QS_1_68_20]